MTKSWLLVSACAALFAQSGAQAATVITQWNFNSVPPDSSNTTGSTAPSVGTGSASVIGGVNQTFASGIGSSDPALADNTGFQTTNYPAQGTGDKTAGAQFLVSTLGYKDITIGYDLRHSNSSSRYEQVQYTVNGTTWNDVAQFDGNSGDTWFNGRSVDLSSIAGVSGNSSLGFRVLATFAPGTSGYLASNPTSAYATTGTWRFDMVTVSGTAVPVPAALPLMFSSLAVLGALVRRRQNLSLTRACPCFGLWSARCAPGALSFAQASSGHV